MLPLLDDMVVFLYPTALLSNTLSWQISSYGGSKLTLPELNSGENTAGATQYCTSLYKFIVLLRPLMVLLWPLMVFGNQNM